MVTHHLASKLVADHKKNNFCMVDNVLVFGNNILKGETIEGNNMLSKGRILFISNVAHMVVDNDP